MFRKFLVFLAFFAFGFLPGQPADAQNNPIAQAAYNTPKTDFIPIDERQISIECRFITAAPEVIAPNGPVGGLNGFIAEDGWHSTPKPQGSLRFNEWLEKGEEAVGTVNILEDYFPTFSKFVNEKEANELFQRVQGSYRDNILQAPKITVFNGQSGTVCDVSETPFVTGVNVKAYLDGSEAYQPVIEVLKEGTLLKFTAEIQEDGSVFLRECHCLFQKIEGKHNNFRPPEGLIIQTPKINTICVKMPITIPQGQSLLIAFPGTHTVVGKMETSFFGFGKKKTIYETQMYCLMITPKVIDPDESEKPVQETQNRYTSENLRQIEDEWESFFGIDQ